MPNFVVKYTPWEESIPAKLSFYKNGKEFWSILIMPEEKQFDGKEGESLLSTINSDSNKLIKELKKLKSEMAATFVKKFEAAQQKREAKKREQNAEEKKQQRAAETRIAAERLLCHNFDIRYNRLQNAIEFESKVNPVIVASIKIMTDVEKSELEQKLQPGSSKLFLLDFSRYTERGDAAKIACQKYLDNLATITNSKQPSKRQLPLSHRSPFWDCKGQDKDKTQDYGPSRERKKHR